MISVRGITSYQVFLKLAACYCLVYGNTDWRSMVLLLLLCRTQESSLVATWKALWSGGMVCVGLLAFALRFESHLVHTCIFSGFSSVVRSAKAGVSKIRGKSTVGMLNPVLDKNEGKCRVEKGRYVPVATACLSRNAAEDKTSYELSWT